MRVANVEIRKFDRFLSQVKMDPYTKTAARQLRHAMTLLPMARVLALVPGDTATAKAERVGVSRNTWYGWNRGVNRPTKVQARRLQHLTGIRAERFQGRR